MSQVIINGFSEDGLKVLVQQVNCLLLKREKILTFSGKKGLLVLRPDAKIVLRDLFIFLNKEEVLGAEHALGAWHNIFIELRSHLEYKAKRYFEDFSVSLTPVLGE